MGIPGTFTRTTLLLLDILRLSAGGRQNRLAITRGQPNGRKVIEWLLQAVIAQKAKKSGTGLS